MPNDEFYKNPEKPGIRVRADGGLEYEDLSTGGYTAVEFPTPKGSPTTAESVQARFLPQHIIGAIERQFDPRFAYLGQNKPAEVFGHYAGVLQGLGLVDNATSRQLDKLIRQFDETSGRDEQEKFFKETIKPFIGGLRPGRRSDAR